MCYIEGILPRSAGGIPIATTKAITKWNVLAFAVVLIGGAATLLSDQMWLRKWAESGQRYTIDQWHTIDLPEGASLVYYQSPGGSAPSTNVDFNIRDPDGKYVHWRRPMDDHNFAVPFGGPAGRAMWEIDLEEPMTFSFAAMNDNPLEEGESREDDRIVFRKEPPTPEETEKVQQTIRITGGTITLVLALILYTLHWFSLRETTTR